MGRNRLSVAALQSTSMCPTEIMYVDAASDDTGTSTDNQQIWRVLLDTALKVQN